MRVGCLLWSTERAIVWPPGHYRSLVKQLRVLRAVVLWRVQTVKLGSRRCERRDRREGGERGAATPSKVETEARKCVV